jgi:hypothetical protein
MVPIGVTALIVLVRHNRRLALARKSSEADVDERAAS